MSRTRRALVVAALLAGVILLAIPYLKATKSGPGATGAQVGQSAPLFESTDLSGRPIALSDYRGHRVVLNFWASWCIPCRTEFPVLQQMLTQHPDVVVLGVVFQDSDSPARTFLRAQGATWPGVRDPNARIANAYGVRPKPGIPVSVLIDATGRVRGYHYGPLLDAAGADGFVRAGT